MGQEASVPQRVGDELNSSTSASSKAANALRGANDAAAAAVAAANNAAASVFVGQSSSSSSQPQSQQQQHQYALGSNSGNNGTPTMSPTAAATTAGSSSTTSSIMSRSGISSMIQSAKRLSVRANASVGGGGGGESSSSTDAGTNNTATTHVHMNMNGGSTAQHSPLHHQPYYNHDDVIHHGELSPKSQAIMMQQQQQRQMEITNNQQLSQQQQQLTQQQLIQQHYYQKQQQQQQHLEQHTPPLSSAQSTPYHTPQTTPQGSINNIYNVMHTANNATVDNRGDGSSISASDAQTVHTTNVTTTATAATATHQHNVVQSMASLSLTSNSHHGGEKKPMKPNKKGMLATPASPRALALNKMKDNDEDDWAKAWAEDSGSDDDDDEEDEEEEGVGDGGVGSSKVGHATAGGVHQLPPAMPVLTGSSTVMGQQQHHQQQQQQQLHQPQQQYIQQQYIQEQARPPPYTTPGQPQPKEFSTDRVIQQQLFPPQQQQQQYQTPQQQSQQQQAIMGDEDAKLLFEADQALLKDGGSWDSYCADESVDEKPCVEMFDPALRVLGRGSFGRVSCDMLVFFSWFSSEDLFAFGSEFLTSFSFNSITTQVVLVQKQYGQGQGSLFAMKILRKSHLVRRRQIERTKTERKVLARLDHPFLMKLYYAFQTTEKLFLVLDYCPGGELFFHLSRYRRFQEPVARFYAAELMLAIGHLHKHGVIYRDLKPENVLLDAYGHVKLGDFGLAKDGIRHPTQGAKSTCGTPEYMAPEGKSLKVCIDGFVTSLQHSHHTFRSSFESARPWVLCGLLGIGYDII